MNAVASAGCCCVQQIPPCPQHLLLHPCHPRLAVSVGVSMEWTTYIELRNAERPCRSGETPPCFCPDGYRIANHGSYDFTLAGDVQRSECHRGWTNEGIPSRWSWNLQTTEFRNWSSCSPPYDFDPCASLGWASSASAQGDGFGGAIKVGCCTEFSGGGIGECVACDPDGMIVPLWEIDARISEYESRPVAYGHKSIRWNCVDTETFEFAATLDHLSGVRAYKPRFCGTNARPPWGPYGGCNTISTMFYGDIKYGTSVYEQGEWVPDTPFQTPRLGSSDGFNFVGPRAMCESKPSTRVERTWAIYQGPTAMVHRVGTKRVQCNVIPTA